MFMELLYTDHAVKIEYSSAVILKATYLSMFSKDSFIIVHNM